MHSGISALIILLGGVAIVALICVVTVKLGAPKSTKSRKVVTRPMSKRHPKQMAELEAAIKKLLKDSTVLEAKKPTDTAEGTQGKSQFGGMPYFEKGEKWPQSKKGKNLEFVFQVFNDAGVVLPKNIKLVQFFCDYDAMAWQIDKDDWLLKVYETLDTDNALVLQKPDECNHFKYCEIELKQAKLLPDWYDLEESYPEIAALSDAMARNENRKVTDRVYEWDAYDEIKAKLTSREGYGSHLGGYPSWIQENENPQNKDCRFLFQIGSEDKADIVWGDAGDIYVFYDPITKEAELVFQCS